jgi:hypothetical protein
VHAARGRRRYERLVRQIAEIDRAALSAMMVAADRLAPSIQPRDRRNDGRSRHLTDARQTAGDARAGARGRSNGGRRHSALATVG